MASRFRESRIPIFDIYAQMSALQTYACRLRQVHYAKNATLVR